MFGWTSQIQRVKPTYNCSKPQFHGTKQELTFYNKQSNEMLPKVQKKNGCSTFT